METPQERIDKAAKRPESDPLVTPGGTVFDTPEAIERFRMLSVYSALKLESNGIRVYRRGSALATVRRLYGIKARTAAVAVERMRALMIERGIIDVK